MIPGQLEPMYMYLSYRLSAWICKYACLSLVAIIIIVLIVVMDTEPSVRHSSALVLDKESIVLAVYCAETHNVRSYDHMYIYIYAI